MVGWISPVLEDRVERVREFDARLKQCHNLTPHETAFILHYDSQFGDLRPYPWPVDENRKRFKPPALNMLRLTHLFKAPSCYCAWLLGKPYSEAKIGLAMTVDSGASITGCLGQYVAVCAEQKCGYIVKLDIFYAHKHLATRECRRREEPLQTLDPFHFITGDTEESVKRAGLRQVQILRDDSDNALRGSRMLLRREDPAKFLEHEEKMEKLLENGLPATTFWDLFVQCTDCNYVMPRHHFPYSHKCTTSIVEGYAYTSRSAVTRTRLPSREQDETDGDLTDSDDGMSSIPDLASDLSLPDLAEIFKATEH